jgi:hypothetical protein
VAPLSLECMYTDICDLVGDGVGGEETHLSLECQPHHAVAGHDYHCTGGDSPELGISATLVYSLTARTLCGWGGSAELGISRCWLIDVQAVSLRGRGRLS